MKRVMILDSYYPAFIDSFPINDGASYDEELARVLAFGFGTADFFSHSLKALDWETADVIANHFQLQEMWEHERGLNGFVVGEQIAEFKPDVIFLQDVGYFPADRLKEWGRHSLLAAQCSCALDPRVDVTPIDVIFSSLPTHVEKFKALGVRAEYLPLAFDPRMLLTRTMQDIDITEDRSSRIKEFIPLSRPIMNLDRNIEISFVGGVGRASHWRAGTDALEAVAARFGERFHWYGYGLDNLPADSALRKCFRGTAFGRDMYSVYGRSKIAVNRHGEIAAGFTNNLRVFESTGCGALLMTEASPNLHELFPEATIPAYRSADELCQKIEYYLDQDGLRRNFARLGQDWTLSNHTYVHRMKQVSAVLSEVLESRKVRV